MSRTLRVGDKGADVRAVQDVLNFQIRRLEALVVDGAFGPLTKGRVVEFQRANGLSADGVVGPVTAGKLFETERLPLALRIAPNGPAALRAASGIQPPRLIPPLTLPGFPPFKPPPGPLQITRLSLDPASTARLPALTPPGQTLALGVTVPSRNDPLDPDIRSHLQIVSLLNTLPLNFPFRASIIGAVPNPVKSPASFDTSGFRWGVEPLFDLKKLGPPAEFTVGAKAKARFAIELIPKGPSGVKVGVFFAGDFGAVLDYTSEQATSRPLLNLQGSFVTGVGGEF